MQDQDFNPQQRSQQQQPQQSQPSPQQPPQQPPTGNPFASPHSQTPGGVPQGAMPGSFPDGGMNPPAPQPEDNTPANFQLGALLPAKLNVPVQPHALQFDEEKFIRLLAGSISLSRDEKKRIIDTIPKLRQSQIDELIRIFEEEKMKFAQLSKKHVPQLEKLAKQHAQDWQDLEASYKADARKADDQAAADEIRKSLGI